MQEAASITRLSIEQIQRLVESNEIVETSHDGHTPVLLVKSVFRYIAERYGADWLALDEMIEKNGGWDD